ncbi:putative F-box domain, nucleotide-binding alpha-beta plait domain-containing protein [Rosa chinensis]|uniref:Putative F-box domain, nucleotide-binding alpha-beta plait domain-containing protein n=1 Tax=Rosa chinensis TaxID=74649 RepID=A0A2P6PSI5_ROSCH|nr:F-box protein SKIP19-like [Rosa chinensis]PRQ24898.1 putative F-box domain, nucleotide-binding alpha-beta plait domain-containing protein [Rosa chinensis]
MSNEGSEEKHDTLGKKIDVKQAQVQGLTDNSKRIFVGGLPHDLRDEEFKNYFEKFGKITDWDVMFDKENHKPRGFGFITFESEEAVHDVLQKRFHDLNYKSVVVKRAHSQNRNNNRLMKQYDRYNVAPNGYRYGVGYTSGNNPGTLGHYNPYCSSYVAPYGHRYGGFLHDPNPYDAWVYTADYGLWGGQNANNSNIRSWTELPDDVTAMILSRLGAIEILKTAQKVCMTWRKISKDPLMWCRIDLHNDGSYYSQLDKICRQAIDRSSGKLVDISIRNFGNDALLEYITDSSPRIRRLRLDSCPVTDKGLSKVASKLPLLEDLEISHTNSCSGESLEAIGRSCPLLTSMKYKDGWQVWFKFDDTNEQALAIAGTMHGLRYLQLLGNAVTNDGLAKILDSWPHLESLDLRCCFNLNLGGDLQRRCSTQVKTHQLPGGSL